MSSAQFLFGALRIKSKPQFSIPWSKEADSLPSKKMAEKHSTVPITLKSFKNQNLILQQSLCHEDKGLELKSYAAQSGLVEIHQQMLASSHNER